MPITVEKSWITTAGYPAVILFDSEITGIRRGYIGLPKTHSLYGVWTDMDHVGGKPETLFNVHGKITYSGNRHGGQMIIGPEHANDLVPTDPEFWWFGFSCGHIELDDGRAQAYLDRLPANERKMYEGRPVRSLAYAEQQCELFASQIAQKEQITNKSDRDAVRSRVMAYMDNITDLTK